MIRYLGLPLCMVVGCYGSAPPHPASVALPMLSNEAPITVRSQSRTVIENHRKEERTCPGNVTDQKDAKCTVTVREVAEPAIRVETTATYGAEAIDYAQFLVLTDPHYDEKVKRLDELRVRCERANIPRWIGTSLMLAGLAAGIAGLIDGVDASVGYAGLAGMGAGITSYTIGYYGFGGRDCNEARAIFYDVDMRQESGVTKVEGAERADEMAALAKKFNDLHRFAADAPGPSAAASAAPPADEPPR